MGVYAFRSKHADYVKVGHHGGGDAWERVAFRGFNSCIVPRVLKGRTDAVDLELIAWFPRLTRKDEGAVHRLASSVVGEWHNATGFDEEVLPELAKRDCAAGGDGSRHADCHLEEVLLRGKRHVRRRPRPQSK